MKCIKKDEKIKRVTNEVASEEVKKGWKYCPRTEWKKMVRDVKGKEKNERSKEEEVKVEVKEVEVIKAVHKKKISKYQKKKINQ